MKYWEFRDDGGIFENAIKAEDLEAAKELAEEITKNGSWDTKGSVIVRIREVDELGHSIEEGEEDSIEVDVGDDPEPPACVEGKEHEWVSPHEVVGGLDSNPGVWSTGGTGITTREVCGRCGVYRVMRHTGSQRNPGEASEIVEYEDADEASLAYISPEPAPATA